MKIKRSTIISSAVATVAFLGMAIAPAMAEGTYNASFYQVNPGFTSQSWTDHQNDYKPTKITFSQCSLSNGGAVDSLPIKLWDQHGWFPDATVGPEKVTNGCGVVSWYHGSSSHTLNDSTFYWELEKINNSDANRWMDGNSSVEY
jgi:hypothetical protein